MPIVTSSTNPNKSIVAGIRIKRPDRPVTDFFNSPVNKKQKINMDSSDTKTTTTTTEQSVPTTTVNVSKSNDGDNKQQSSSVYGDTIGTLMAPSSIPDLTDQHQKRIQGYIASEKYNSGWAVVEYIDGKELTVLYDGKGEMCSITPYFGPEPIETFEKSLENPTLFKQHIKAIYNKMKKIDPEMSLLALTFVLFGSRVNVGSPYANTNVFIALVDIRLGYVTSTTTTESTTASDGTTSTTENVVNDCHFKYLKYSVIDKLATTKGAFLTEDGKGIEQMCFKWPRVLCLVNSFEQALEYVDTCFRNVPESLPASDLDKAIKVAGLIIKSNDDFQVVPKKQKKNKTYVRMIGKRIVRPETYNDFTVTDIRNRMEGKPVGYEPPLPEQQTTSDPSCQA